MRNYADLVTSYLKKNKLEIATAESCTGGLIAATLVSYEGISSCFQEGYVTYSENGKRKNCDVSEKTLRTYTVVSHEVAYEMAVGVRKRAGAAIGVSVTGIAGPDGGSKERPVGLVYISCAFYGHVVTRQYHFHGTRNHIRKQAVKEAFKLIYSCMKRYQIHNNTN